MWISTELNFSYFWLTCGKIFKEHFTLLDPGSWDRHVDPERLWKTTIMRCVRCQNIAELIYTERKSEITHIQRILLRTRGADKSLALPGRKEAPKHVRDGRDFNNTETRAVIKSGQVRKISPPPGFDPRTVQPLASRYTDYATRPTLDTGGNMLTF